MIVSVTIPSSDDTSLTTIQVAPRDVLAFAIACRDQVLNRVPRGGYEGFSGPDIEQAGWPSLRRASDELRDVLPGVRVTRSHREANRAVDDGDFAFCLWREEHSNALLWLRCTFEPGIVPRGKIVRRERAILA